MIFFKNVEKGKPEGELQKTLAARLKGNQDLMEEASTSVLGCLSITIIHNSNDENSLKHAAVCVPWAKCAGGRGKKIEDI